MLMRATICALLLTLNACKCEEHPRDATAPSDARPVDASPAFDTGTRPDLVEVQDISTEDAGAAGDCMVCSQTEPVGSCTPSRCARRADGRLCCVSASRR